MLNRRTFLKSSFLSGCSAFIPLISYGGDRFSEVFIAESQNSRKAVNGALEMAGGISKFVNKGDVVALKPNMAWAREPEFAANTNPEVVAEVVRQCFRAGAKEVIVTDNPCNNPRSVFNLCKIPMFVQKENAKVFVPQGRHYKNMNIGGNFLTEWPVLEIFKTADKVINIPVAKHHGSSRVTVSMKNWMGAIGGNRGFIHQNLHQGIYELAAFFKPTLNIVDCTRILLNGGPTGGDLKDVKLLNRIVVSTDQVAVDTIASEYLGAKLSEVYYIKLGDKYGLGTSDKTKMNIVYEKI